MLRHPDAGAGHHEPGSGRDVDRIDAVAARAAHIDDILDVARFRVSLHNCESCGDRFRGLPPQPHRREECADLRRRCIPGHDLLKR